MKPFPALLYLLPSSNPGSKSSITITPHGSSIVTSTYKVTVTTYLNSGTDTDNGRPIHYFLKTAKGPTAEMMLRGEYEGLRAIEGVCSDMVPRGMGVGQIEEEAEENQEEGVWFLLTEFIDSSGSRGGGGGGGGRKIRKTESLARKLARLHSTPALGAEGSGFGFPMPTACGSTIQDNTPVSGGNGSWAEWYMQRRLLPILCECERKQGVDQELRELVGEKLCGEGGVVKRLLGGLGEVRAVVVHGDLWSGNWTKGGKVERAVDEGEDGEGGVETLVGDIVFDPSSTHAHSEYDLGMMSMFGGLPSSFYDEYHSYVPKSHPAEEYEDRVKLYELYHHLNHYAMFGGSYRGSAVRIMRGLVGRYGEE